MIIQPKLSFDFTAASLSPLIALTRVGATATRVNSSGNIEIVAADVARFDYDPVTLAPKGLLIEEQRVNLLTYSEQFDNANWNKSNTSVTANTTTAPDGTLTADTFTPDTTNTIKDAFQTVTATLNTAYTSGVFIKSGGDRYAFLMVNQRNSGAFVGYAAFIADLQTATLSSVVTSNTAPTNASATLTDDGDGWYRMTVTATTAASGINQVRVNVGVTNSATAISAFVGNGTDGIFIWGAQLEAGAFATSYIPTEATVVTRNADVATITGTNFSDFWQAGKGGVLIRALPSTVSGIRPLVQFDDNTADNIIALRGNTNSPELYIKATTDQATIDAGTIAANTAYRLAGTWVTDNCAANLNGGVPVLDTSATIPVVTQMRLGSDGTNYLNGHLQSIEYYNERILNSNLQVVSSPAGYRSIIGPVLRDSIIT
jgi:hypothetical protein